MQKQKILFLTLLLGLFFSCEKERIRTTGPNNNPNPSKYLLVGNEGSFGTNTASISLIDLANNTVENGVYKDRNGTALGDVLQSIERIGDYYYFIINNSNKIVVTDTNFSKKAEIKGLTSPRYMKAVSSTRAYVTSLFNDKIYVVDLLSNTKIAEVQMDKNWTEQMVLTGDATGNYIYVCENDTAINYITKINVISNQIVDKINIGGVSPSQIGITSDNHLWVLAGNNYYGKTSTLTEVDPMTKSIVKSFTFNPAFTTGQMAIGPNDEKYVAVVDYSANNYGVYKFENGTATVPNNFFISNPTGVNYYGLAVDPLNGDVYISDSKGFSQAGEVNQYTSNGVLKNTWITAIGPSSFHFVQ